MRISRMLQIAECIIESAGQRPEIKSKEYDYERDDKEISPLSVMPLNVVFVPHNCNPISQRDLFIILKYSSKRYVKRGLQKQPSVSFSSLFSRT